MTTNQLLTLKKDDRVRITKSDSWRCGQIHKVVAVVREGNLEYHKPFRPVVWLNGCAFGYEASDVERVE